MGLSSIGGAIGGALGGPMGSVIGGGLGGAIGGALGSGGGAQNPLAAPFMGLLDRYNAISDPAAVQAQIQRLRNMENRKKAEAQAVQPRIEELFDRNTRAGRIYEGQLNRFAEDRTPFELRKRFLDQGMDLVQQGQGIFDRFQSDVLSNPLQNPLVQQAMQQQADLVTENLQQNILPQLTANASASGLLGSNRQGIAQALATQKANQDILRSATGLQNHALDRQLQGFSSLPAAMSTLTTGLGLQAQGQELMNQRQQMLNQTLGLSPTMNTAFGQGLDMLNANNATIMGANLAQDMAPRRLLQTDLGLFGALSGQQPAPSQKGGSRLLGALGGGLAGASAGAQAGGSSLGAVIGGLFS